MCIGHLLNWSVKRGHQEGEGGIGGLQKNLAKKFCSHGPKNSLTDNNNNKSEKSF